MDKADGDGAILIMEALALTVAIHPDADTLHGFDMKSCLLIARGLPKRSSATNYTYCCSRMTVTTCGPNSGNPNPENTFDGRPHPKPVKLQTLDPSSTLNPEPLGPKPETLNPEPLKPQTRRPEPLEPKP